MYIRLTFDNGQRISSKEVEELSKTLADQIDCDRAYMDLDGNLTDFYSWQHTTNPEDPEIITEKKKLVRGTDLFKLNSNKEYLADFELFIQKHPDLKIHFRGTPPTITHDYSSMIQQIYAIQQKFEDALKSFDQQIEFNQKCDVHVANLGLLHINQLGYAVDFCTETLQDILNKGWRIIACCVQPDGRRPDYILGRYNPDEENLSCIKF